MSIPYEIPFPIKGANPNVKDIFLEVDYLAEHSKESVRGSNNHLFNIDYEFKPTENMLRKLSQAFLEPKDNGKANINFHVELSNEIPFRHIIGYNLNRDIMYSSTYYNNGLFRFNNGVSEVKDTTLSGNQWLSFYDFKDVKEKNMHPFKSLFYHYAVMGFYRWDFDRMIRKTWTGRAEIIGNDFLIAYPFKKQTNLNTNDVLDVIHENRRLGTLIHELGHNLGLLHNGNTTFPKDLISIRANRPDDGIGKILDNVII